MKTLILQSVFSKILFYISIFYFCIIFVNANSDTQCCRKKIDCFECDSRFDPRCGDAFNLTRETGIISLCDDYCVKLKHMFENKYYYLRTCADSLKKIYIKKTDVCYTTRTADSGSLCFCDQDLCNKANSLYDYSSNLKLIFSLILVIFLSKTYLPNPS